MVILIFIKYINGIIGIWYTLLPLSFCLLPVQQRVQGNRISIQGDGRWPLIGQVGSQLLSGAQIIVLQHCAKRDSVQCWLHKHVRRCIEYIHENYEYKYTELL